VTIAIRPLCRGGMSGRIIPIIRNFSTEWCDGQIAQDRYARNARRAVSDLSEAYNLAQRNPPDTLA
jgi:hypothetical protein